MLAKATNHLKASFAVLSTLLGDREPQTFVLADEPMPPNIIDNVYELIQEALAQRPDLARQRLALTQQLLQNVNQSLQLAQASSGSVRVRVGPRYLHFLFVRSRLAM